MAKAIFPMKEAKSKMKGTLNYRKRGNGSVVVAKVKTQGKKSNGRVRNG